MKKSFIIIMLVLSIGLIGFGIFLGIKDKSEKVYEGIVDVEAELEKENVITENVDIYRTLDDAIDYLKEIYLTEDVVVTSSDEFKVYIVVLKGTEEETSYVYHVRSGDLNLN